MPEPTDPLRSAESAESQRNEAMRWHHLAAIGMEFIVAILLCGGIGWWMDSKFNTSPWLLITGMFLGFAVGLMIMWRASRQMFR